MPPETVASSSPASWPSRLPAKALHAIIEEVWRLPATKHERWDLYLTLAASHPRLRETLVSIASRNIFLRYGPSRKDIELYQLVASQVVPDSSTQDTPIATASAPSSDSPSANWRAVLQTAHIDFDFTMLIHDPHGKLARLKAARAPGGMLTHEARPITDPPVRSEEVIVRTERWESYLHDVRAAILPDCPCPSVTAFCAHKVPHCTACTLLRELAELFPALTHIYLRFDWTHPPDEDDGWLLAGGHFPTIRFLRLAVFPECRCTPAGTHRKGCVSPHLFRLFPNVRHLHLDSPVFLKLLDPPHSLDTVTLEAPPKAYIAGREPFATIMGYNVAAALRRGFLRWSDRGDLHEQQERKTKTIVVRTGAVDPQGFEAAKAACGEYGIAIEKEVVYVG
ncbi:hypothetical protein C8Q80DRAFT_4772 [Daedaleopsis nitida]|nr:hypothetical protein C8Q80DRAFT_4772 [Daedaleopsis nitida]